MAPSGSAAESTAWASSSWRVRFQEYAQVQGLLHVGQAHGAHQVALLRQHSERALGSEQAQRLPNWVLETAYSSASRWFQRYPWKDREKSRALLQRAAAAGYDTLRVTVDTPVAGQRLRDARNGMVIPPKLNLKTVLDASCRPEWWFN